MNQLEFFPDENTIELSWSEIQTAATLGVLRNLYNLKHRKFKDWERAGSWQRQIEGTIGELVVAKRLNLYWTGNVGNLKGGDVGGYEVRARASDGSGGGTDLGIKPTDNDGKVFILVLANTRLFRVVGWYRSEEAKRPEWLNNGGEEPVYYVPRDLLHPMATLPAP